MTAPVLLRPTWCDWTPPTDRACVRCGWRYTARGGAVRCPRCLYQETAD